MSAADRDAPQTEAEYLAQYDPSAFDRPSVAVDVALVSVHEDALSALLVERASPPHRGRWALPGGFVGIDEPIDAAAHRVLRDKLGVSDVFIEQLYTFGAVDRDPRMRIISVAYLGLLPAARLEAAQVARPGLRRAQLVVPWEGEAGGPIEVTIDGASVPLAFDHGAILGLVVKRLRGKIDYAPIAFELLPERFTLRALQAVHEAVLGRPANKDSFRRRLLASGQIIPTGEREAAVGHRPAALYRWTEKGR